MKHPSTSSSETISELGLPWEIGNAQSEDVLHWVIAWSLDEPERIGETTAMTAPCLVGRGPARSDQEVPQATFARVRAGSIGPTPPLSTRRLSRRQAFCEPIEPGGVRVQNVGRRLMRHNGRRASVAVVSSGDTIAFDDAVIFLAEVRPRIFPSTKAYPKHALRFGFGAPDPYGIVGESAPTWRLREQLAFAASTNNHALILGESGVGKELAATALHALSSRSGKPLVSRNAATFPESLIDAELFGNRENYPNVGTPMRQGLIGEADGSNLFLDEIGELPEKQQTHLLRVLDASGEYQRLGDSRTLRADFRLLAATNRPIAALKSDLLARFSVRLHVPGLNERRSDIAMLVNTLFSRPGPDASHRVHRFFDFEVLGAARPRIAPALMDALVRHTYTHHVRELDRLIWLSASSSQGDFLELTDEVIAELRSGPSPEDANEPLAAQILEALRAAQGNKTEAARLLGLKSRFALYRLMRKQGL